MDCIWNDFTGQILTGREERYVFAYGEAWNDSRLLLGLILKKHLGAWYMVFPVLGIYLTISY